MIFPPFRLFARIFSRKPPHNTFLRVLPRRCHRVHRPRRQYQPNFALHEGAAKFRQNFHAAFLRPPGQQGADGPQRPAGQRRGPRLRKAQPAPGGKQRHFRSPQQLQPDLQRRLFRKRAGAASHPPFFRPAQGPAPVEQRRADFQPPGAEPNSQHHRQMQPVKRRQNRRRRPVHGPASRKFTAIFFPGFL